ncbi:MAG: DUF234 domain-containing protein [Sneathiella sp.]|nr:DUF234 domain-containing protein [Sneathiella sp.]
MSWLYRSDPVALHLGLIQAGRWWDKNTEIDLLGIGEDKRHVVFGECKYTARPVDTDVYFQLLEKSHKVNLGKTGQKHYALFSQSGFSDALRNLAHTHENIHLETVS